MEKSFAWDADMVNGTYDREYLFEDFANYFATFIGNGYVPRTGDALQVIANDDMTVTLRKGKAFMDGYMYENTDDLILQLDPADGVLRRIDRISIVWSKGGKDIHANVLKGSPSYNPVPIPIRRNADYKDYVVADILVEAGAIRITQRNITDQRLNEDVCGMAAGILLHIDTSEFYKQIQDDLERFREENEGDFAEWKKICEEAMQKYFDDTEKNVESMTKEVLDALDDLVELNGPWKNDVAYKRYSIVTITTTEETKGYVAINNVPVGLMPPNDTYWAPITLKGDKGADGVVVSIDKHYAFEVENGHLYLYYPADAEPPNYYINENGHLIHEMVVEE